MVRRFLNAASILCLVACVALMGLWLCSYYWNECVHVHYGNVRIFSVRSESGLALLSEDIPYAGSDRLTLWFERYPTFPLRGFLHSELPQGFWTAWGFQEDGSWDDAFLILPYWFLVLTTGSLAMLCRLRWPWRFTLRSLFVVTTFLAVVMGMIAWLDRAWIGK